MLGVSYEGGQAYEESIFARSNVFLPQIRKPRGFRDDVRRIIKSITRGRSQERFPRTPVARDLYFRTKKLIEQSGIQAKGLRLFSLLGTDADDYYETDGLFYLPSSCGCECVVTVDARLIGNRSLSVLRNYWIQSSTTLHYSEERFQTDLFRHNRIYREKRALAKIKKTVFPESWPMHGESLMDEYKKLWSEGYLAPVHEEMVDRPIVRPENHLILTPRHLHSARMRQLFARQVAIEFWKQVFRDRVETGDICPLSPSPILSKEVSGFRMYALNRGNR